MKNSLYTILFTLYSNILFSQISDCEKGMVNAENDIKDSILIFHTSKGETSNNTLFYLLEKKYNIDRKFVSSDSTNYYSCYDSILTRYLQEKISENFILETKKEAEILDQDIYWKSQPEFPGGQIEMFKFIRDSLKIEFSDYNEYLKTKIIIQFVVSKNGEIKNIKTIKGISPIIDEKVITIFNKMPKWKPAFELGSPVEIIFTLPITIEVK